MSPTPSTRHRGSRRGLLTTLGTAALGAFAGCLDDVGAGGDSDESPADSQTGDDSDTPGSDPSDSSTQLRLTHTDPGTVDGPVAVYPPSLRDWLRRASTGEETLRVHAQTPVYDPDPLLPSLPAVSLPTDAGRQSYEVVGEGGTRYDLLVGAEEVDSAPDDVDPVPVDSLSSDRRDLVRRVIDDSRVTVTPETPLGEWVRTTFFGGYVAADGTVYRGYERRQTDAEFFARGVWLVFSLDPVASAPDGTLSLSLPPIPEAVRAAVDPVLSDAKQRESLTTATVPQDDTLVDFADSWDYLLTHTSLFVVSVAD